MGESGLIQKLIEMDIPHVREDRRYIEKHLASQPPETVESALEDYKSVWNQAADKEPVEHKKENAGRRAANIFLRTVVWPSLCETTKSAA